MASSPAEETTSQEVEALRGALEAARRSLDEEGLRLEKLWDAYKLQEEEYREAQERIRRLEASLEDRDASAAEREKELQARDERIRALEGEKKSLELKLGEMDRLREELKALDAYKDRVAELEQAYAEERERLAKLYLVFEDVESERDELKAKLEAAESG